MMRARLAWCLLALGGVVRPALAQDQDVLPPEQAYPFEITATADRLDLDFGVLDGYYLYRKRFEFSTDTPGVTLGAPEYPAGQVHSDEFFGDQEIYRGKFRIAIPYQRSADADQVMLELHLQGCADIGLCYPPQTWTREVALPGETAAATDAPSSAAPSAAASSALPALLGGTARSDAGDGPLPPDQAFVVNARFDGPNTLTVGWQIAKGYYLYRDKLGIASTSDGIELGAIDLPGGTPHRDESFGNTEVYYDYVEAQVPFSRASPDAFPVSLRISYQGCKEQSLCYPPASDTLTLDVPAASQFAAAAATPPPLSEQDRWSALLTGDSWLAFMGLFYLGGLALSLTPCVLPMVPILSGIIAGQGKVTAGRGFLLSVSYVLGMAITYTVAGALAALAGGQIQAVFQKPWIIALFAGLFAVLALGMFGAFELQMPAAVQTRLANLANRQRAGTFIGTAIIGALSALIVTTCVAPPLVGALAVIGQTGDVPRGAAALFALSIGMGTPLLAVGASAGQLLPRVGPWMNTVKAAFGVVFLGVAIWMLQRVLPGPVTLALWAVLVFLTGVFLGAFEPLRDPATAPRRLSKGVGVLACLYGALMLIGATLGGERPLEPIPLASGLLAQRDGARAEPKLTFERVDTLAQLESALAGARERGAPVMIDFTADWCVSCKEMEEYTFPDSGVVAALAPFVLLRADVTANTKEDRALLSYFHSYGPPTIAFYDRSGKPQEAYKLVGFVPPEKFVDHVSKLAAL